MTYFIWRRDVIGVLGQGTGFMIYLRNLWLIYHPRHHVDAAADTPGTTPEDTPGEPPVDPPSEAGPGQLV